MLDERSPDGANNKDLNIRPTPRAEMGLYKLDSFAYEFPGNGIWVEFEMPEFTAICPYVPNQLCIELKSLKLYINSFREVKIFHEHVVNVILEDFVNACDPLKVEIEGDFHVRGNIKTIVRTSYAKG